jgi:type I restriction enzyme, S subunit
MAGEKEWPTCAVGDFLETIIDYRGKTPPKSASGIPLISAANVKGGRVVLDDPAFISLPDYEKWTRRGFTQPGDVLITTEAPAGEVAPYPRTGTYQISRRVMALRPNPKELDSGFLLYALLSSEVNQRLLSLSRGTTVPRVLKTDITDLEIPYPLLPEQKAIAEILGTLDAKIELNRRMNETLESLARSIFKSWFIDFDPVRAKMDGRTPPNLPPATAALFPDSFRLSEIGKIPSGWESKQLSDIFTLRGGLSYKAVFLADEGNPLVTMGCVSGTRRFEASKLKRYTGDYQDAHLLHAGDLVIATRDVTQNCELLGSPAMVPESLAGQPIIAATNLYKVMNKSSVPNEFLYQVLRTPDYREQITASAKGTTVLMLTKDAVEHYRFAFPNREVLEVFDKTVSPVIEKAALASRESETLAALRDTLLPRLLTGELRVADAELLAEEAL